MFPDCVDRLTFDTGNFQMSLSMNIPITLLLVFAVIIVVVKDEDAEITVINEIDPVALACGTEDRQDLVEL